jgi:hypothetical protein
MSQVYLLKIKINLVIEAYFLVSVFLFCAVFCLVLLLIIYLYLYTLYSESYVLRIYRIKELPQPFYLSKWEANTVALTTFKENAKYTFGCQAR